MMGERARDGHPTPGVQTAANNNVVVLVPLSHLSFSFSLCLGLDGCINYLTLGENFPIVLYQQAVEGSNVDSCRLRKRRRSRGQVEQEEGDEKGLESEGGGEEGEGEE